MLSQARELLLQGRLTARRDDQRLSRPRTSAGSRSRGFFQDQMGVGAADAEGTDAGASWLAGLGSPGLQAVVDVERRGGEINLRVGLVEVKGGRELSVFESEDGLDEASDACGGVEVADVALDRADGAEASLF